MNIPSLECANCGSKQIRRARYLNWGERLRGILGIHPFRCRKCTHRFLVSIWLFGKLRYAKCPRCLGLELTTWSRRYYKVGLTKNFLIVFGAQKYRCPACRCNFVSFLPRKAAPKSGEQPDDIPDTHLHQTADDEADEVVFQPEVQPEELIREAVRQTHMDDGKPAAQQDSPDRISGPQTAAPSARQLCLTTLDDEAGPDPTQHEHVQARPLKEKPKARSRRSTAEKTARKKITRKTLNQEPPPEQASGLSSG